MSGRGLPVAIVHACLRDGSGGSPTAVLDEAPLSDPERRRVPVLLGTSHAVFVSVNDDQPSGPSVSLRFFTSKGELPACGHGTIAALAFLADRSRGREYRATLHTPERVFPGSAVREKTHVTAAFDTGAVELRDPTGAECDLILPALGVASNTIAPGTRVASAGRPRLLVPLTSRSALTALVPDLERLRAACDRLGILGCYVYSAPTSTGRVAARMFAPSIGVAEDIANANSTACLAAHLARRGITSIAVDMGDSLGNPATITASAQPSPSGTTVHLGGAARIAHAVHLEE
ncbi:PhzF family phenazine biosynthesis protein [Streptantibioticus rubrisoli]|uniref:PhzF family phenazine biosynthesis isomerase n=1 Tax=Streptantibioticus rubrisoli TaxID=1387313 RepID=A0ABT1PLW6_9ACTN|nr:PhzF family phenazine biosynthesis isomerase [Streptantibioticus rubrisoli]MCQ4045285.1 PhzF family phenazine biosynthesis isomerase [Streptantibioticus rubrisoli]